MLPTNRLPVSMTPFGFRAMTCGCPIPRKKSWDSRGIEARCAPLEVDPMGAARRRGRAGALYYKNST